MNHEHPRSSPGRHVLDGALWVLAGDALFPVSGLIIAAFLCRRLGPEGYGRFTLTVALVTWIEWTFSALFTRTAIKFVRQAKDWESVAHAVVRLQAGAGLGAMAALAVLARPVAALLGEPGLVPYLRLLALDIPIFCLALAHRDILIGLGAFRRRALGGALRWTARLVLTVGLVAGGLSVAGGLLGMLGASLVELGVYRSLVQPRLLGRSTFPLGAMTGYAGPLFLHAISLRLFEKLDLFMLKILGNNVQQAGVYGAAQNLALLPGLFAMALGPVLLSTLSLLTARGEDEAARRLAAQALRGVFLLLPGVALLAGAAPGIVRWIFGPAYLEAAPLLALLLFGSLAQLMISLATAMLTAGGRPGWCVAIGVTLVPLVLGGHLVMIPWLGPTGAAAATALVSCVGALIALGLVYGLWRIVPPPDTVLRGGILAAVGFLLTRAWPVHDAWLLVQLTAATGMIALAFGLLGEFGSAERALLRSLFRPLPKMPRGV